MRKLTNDVVKKLKCDLAARVPQRRLATQYGVSRSLVSDISTERRYADIDWPNGRPIPRPAVPEETNEPVLEGDYDPTNCRIQELEGQVIHLTTERNRARQVAKSNAKVEGLFTSMSEVLTDRIVPISPLPTVRKVGKRGLIEEHVVLHLSDGHHDQVVSPEECGGLERYDFPISCCRAERLVDSTLQWTQETLSGFTFPVLNVLSYGDFTGGEIHGAAERSYYRNQMQNCLAIGKLHALMYRDLAANFPLVNVVYVPGNHGRRSQKKNYHGAQDNWDYLVAKIAALYCEDIENITFLIPDCFSVNLDINGIGFNIAHGDDIRSNMGIPFYGLQRRQQRLQSLAPLLTDCPRIRYYCVGHFHNKAILGAQDTETIMNGPWVATDAYAYNSLSAYTQPSQWLHGVSSKHGITWRLDVHLKDSVREAIGPKRYIIEV